MSIDRGSFVRLARAVLSLIRIDLSFFGFLCVFAPLLLRTKDWQVSFRGALPLLFISMCTFIANDLHDIERDVVNHPGRPLPSGEIAPAFAATLYFVCLASAIWTIREYVSNTLSSWYYLLAIATISYGFIVEFLPPLKAPYVAACGTIPVLIIASAYPGETGLRRVAIAVFLFTLGRELCLDVVDRPGDDVSLLHHIAPDRIAAVSLFLQMVALLLLATLAAGIGDVIAVLLLVCLFGLSYFYWFKQTRYRAAVATMKLEVLVGLYFVL